jgi:hypothetical protein
MRGCQWDGTIGSPRNAKLEHRYFCQDTRDHEAELVQLRQGVTACINTTWGLLPVSVEPLRLYPYQGGSRYHLCAFNIRSYFVTYDANVLELVNNRVL